jgi:ABC-type antimicrobial peptide transport system permease subunit
MNPLFPLTYYRRHKRSTLLLVTLIVLATIGIFMMVAVLDSIPLRAQASYLTEVSRVYPKAGDSLGAGIVSQIQVHPHVEKVILSNSLSINYPVLIGGENLNILGVSPSDADYMMQHAGLRIKEGRLFESRSNEIVLDEAIIRALNLQVGDEIARKVNERYYFSVVAPLKVVGILESDPAVSASKNLTPHFGFISGEYLDSHELYAPNRQAVVVIPKDGQLATVNDFLEFEIASDYTGVENINELIQFVGMARQALYLVFGLVNGLVAVIVALVVAAVNRIAMMQRLEEMAVLNALGFDKRALTRRLIAESALVTGLGWLIGLFISLVFLAFLRDTVLYSRGEYLDIWNLAPFIFVIPIPLAVIISTFVSVRRIFAQLDAVQILERGTLSSEYEKPRRATGRSTTKPLSSLTFYKRHRRRGITLVVTMALMILGVAFPAFLMLTSVSTMKTEIEIYRNVSRVYPAQGKTVDPGFVAQIRSHPDVERVVPTLSLGIQMLVPPGGASTIPLYGVPERDMALLLEKFDVYLLEGQLPHPYSNELVISESIAKNRGLAIGDTVGGASGDESDPLTASGDILPTEMVISGILGPDAPWVGLASYEFLGSHELTRDRSERLLIIPVAGREGAVNEWLVDNAATTQTGVDTYATAAADFQEFTLGVSVAFALVESLIALVAAVALATLNYIFFSQRWEEFGILHAIGRNRQWLITRTFRETGSTVLVAWLIGAAICLLGLVLAQIFIYSPLGLKADFSNLLPWLFTLPVPIAVVVVSTGTIGRKLRKLDPVAIIERR